jgi:hypothetical protein
VNLDTDSIYHNEPDGGVSRFYIKMKMLILLAKLKVTIKNEQ